MLHRLIVLAASFLTLGALRAELTWEKPIQEFHRSPQDKFVETKFGFKNTGRTPVSIDNVRTSCGCTTADPDKKTYAPGESGEIKVKFNFSGRRGGQRKTVRVFTNDRGNEPSILDLRVFIEEAMTISPSLVFWRNGESPATKAVQVNAPPERPVRIKAVRSTNPAFAATLQTDKPGERYTIAITPTATGARQAGEISIETDYPPDAPRTYTVHARVK